MNHKTRVAVIGAGFAGLSAVRTLRGTGVDVTLIDQNNYFTFQPLLYQVATAQLNPEELASNLRGGLRRHRGITFRQGRVRTIDWEQRRVLLEDGAGIDFDYVIQCAGSVYNHFGTKGVPEHAFFLKSLTQAVNLRSHILRQFELADQQPEAPPEGLLDFVIVGGGTTGVELAGALLELIGKVLPRDYPGLDFSRARVHLIEAQAHLLAPYSEGSRRHAETVLTRRGARLHLQTVVEAVSADGVTLVGGGEIRSHTVIWAAGVRGSRLNGEFTDEPGRGHRLRVNDDLSVPGHPGAFAAGDAVGEVGAGRWYPQVAIQQGRFAARQILRSVAGLSAESFSYRDKGSMAMVARNSGIAELAPGMGGFRFRGFIGWLAWLFLHLLYLPGHRNRIFAVMTWLFSYLTYDRHARLIAEMEPGPGDFESRLP